MVEAFVAPFLSIPLKEQTMKRRTYTKKEFIKAVKTSYSIRQVLIKLNLNPKGGGSYRAFYQATKDFKVNTSHFKGMGWNKGKKFPSKKPIKDYLSNKISIQSYKLKLRLIKEELLKWKCSNCNRVKWLGKSIPLNLDHIDGNHDNNDVANLQTLCANCHRAKTMEAGDHLTPRGSNGELPSGIKQGMLF